MFKSIKHILVSIGLLLLLSSTNAFCDARSQTEQLNYLINLFISNKSQQEIQDFLGHPFKIEMEKKQNVWYYNAGDANFAIYWSKDDSKFRKVSFSTVSKVNIEWDERNARFLKTGETRMTDVVKNLGIPREMLLKESNQEVHYNYNNNVLRLFFRKGVLVNYCLY